ncbi:MAG: hypothetical protein K8S54_09350 [Spirochaetia bacterium]|nr:hypothetical protein [Spirochaetia bacterium]
MKRFRFVIFSLLLVAVASLQAQAFSWGAYEGQLSWSEANARCSSKSMRLPTRAELLNEFRLGGNRQWDQFQYGYYWSETMLQTGLPFYVHMDVGVSGLAANGVAFVRCVSGK